MCMVDYGDAPKIYRARMQCTRKERRCEECGRTIAVGERYQSAFMVYDGDPSTFATCQHCAVAMKWLAENCGGYMHGAVWEDFEEHISEYPPLGFSLSRLSVARRRDWMRFDGSGLMPIPAVPPSIASIMEEAQ